MAENKLTPDEALEKILDAIEKDLYLDKIIAWISKILTKKPTEREIKE